MDITAIAITAISSAGVAATLFSTLVKRIERKIDVAEAKRNETDQKRIEHEAMLIGVTMASLDLARETAEAVKRIPDAHCNGEMDEALRNAKKVQNDYRDFERRQVVASLDKGA